jgi:hypothetical protein
MAALIIPNGTPFGSMTNQTTSKLLGLNTTMARLKDAIATAASGYTGVEGTEYEAATMGMNMMGQNNFGVAPDQANPGVNGLAYAYAVNTLIGHWEAFWVLAEASISQLDNGGSSM